MASSPDQVLFSPSLPRTWNPVGCSRVLHRSDTTLGDATLLQCERGFKTRVQEELTGGPQLGNPF